MSKRAAIYTRLSKDRPEERSRADQEADCRALLAAKGYEVVATFTDLESGYRRTAKRPGYQALLDGLAAGDFEAVAVWKLDRLTRQGIRQLAPLLDVLDATGAKLLSVHDSIDTSTAMGEGMLGVIASMAKAESENISVRTKRAKRHHAENGRHKDGGPRAFGLTAGWAEVVPEEADLIREAADRILSGESLRAVALDWGRRGVMTTTGRPWTTQALRQLLLQPRLYGVRVYDGRVVGRGSWPAILDHGTWAKLKAVLEDPRRRAGAPTRSYLLTGYLRCGRCGRKMRAHQPKDGKRKYACPPKPEGCNGCTIVADDAEAEVVAQVLAALDTPELQAATEDDDALTAAVEEDEAMLTQLAKDYAERLIGRAEWLEARDAVQERLDANRAKLAEAAVRVPMVDLPDRWEALTFDQRRTVLAAVIDRVNVTSVGRGKRVPAGDRLTVIWRV